MAKQVSVVAVSRWDVYVSGRFRLAGFGGAAVVLRSAVVPVTVTGREGSALVFDVGLVDRSRRVHFLLREADPGLVDRLSVFFRSAAADASPEVTVPTFQDEHLGLILMVQASTTSTVDLLAQVVDDLSADVKEFSGLDFSTTRTALASAAVEVRWLDAVDDGGESGGEPLFWDEEE